MNPIFITWQNALLRPFENWRNIYFGLIMGVSASLPTCIHICMFFRSGWNNLVSERAL